jgi:hypothetical protein
MHTLEEDVGTTPVDQLEAVSHCPEAAVFQLSVQDRGRTFVLRLTAPAGKARIPSTRTIPANAVTEIISALGTDVSLVLEPFEEETTPPAIAHPFCLPAETIWLVYHRPAACVNQPSEIELCFYRTGVTDAPCATNRTPYDM